LIHPFNIKDGPSEINLQAIFLAFRLKEAGVFAIDLSAVLFYDFLEIKRAYRRRALFLCSSFGSKGEP
jgi:hypothetical protein